MTPTHKTARLGHNFDTYDEFELGGKAAIHRFNTCSNA